MTFALRAARLVVAATLAAGAVPAHAALFRAYLALDGADTNPCTLPEPCRLLPAALAAVADGGEIWMLDSANYNTSTVTIERSVTVLAVPGVLGSVVANGGAAVEITKEGIAVTLRNLSIRPLAGSGVYDGVRFLAGASLFVQDVAIHDFGGGRGLVATATGHLTIVDSVFRANAWGLVVAGPGTIARAVRSHFSLSGVAAGAIAEVAGATPSLTVERCVAAGNDWGFIAESHVKDATSRLVVNESVMSANRNAGAGAAVLDVLAGFSQAVVRASLASDNGIGLRAAGAGALLVASGNTVTRNATGFSQSPGALLETALDNILQGNTAPVAGVASPFAKN